MNQSNNGNINDNGSVSNNNSKHKRSNHRRYTSINDEFSIKYQMKLYCKQVMSHYDDSLLLKLLGFEPWFITNKLNYKKSNDNDSNDGNNNIDTPMNNLQNTIMQWIDKHSKFKTDKLSIGHSSIQKLIAKKDPIFILDTMVQAMYEPNQCMCYLFLLYISFSLCQPPQTHFIHCFCKRLFYFLFLYFFSDFLFARL